VYEPELGVIEGDDEPVVDVFLSFGESARFVWGTGLAGLETLCSWEVMRKDTYLFSPATAVISEMMAANYAVSSPRCQ